MNVARAQELAQLLADPPVSARTEEGALIQIEVRQIALRILEALDYLPARVEEEAQHYLEETEADLEALLPPCKVCEARGELCELHALEARRVP